MAGGDFLQRGLEPDVGLDAVHLAGLDEAGDATPCARALVVAREQRVFRGQLDRSDSIFDEVAVHLDAPVVQEGQQAVPMVGDVGQLFAEARAGRDARALLVEPHAEGVHQRRRFRPADRLARRRRLAPDPVLDPVELRDAFQTRLGDRRAIAVEHSLKAAPGMGPTCSQRQRPSRPVRPAQPVVAGIAVDLHRSPEALEQLLAMLAATAGRIVIHHARRVRPGPGPLVAHHRPHVAGPGLAPSRVENPNRGLVQPQVVRRLQRPLQAFVHGPKVERRLADPAGQG